jgi:hypothetical protein
MLLLLLPMLLLMLLLLALLLHVPGGVAIAVLLIHLLLLLLLLLLEVAALRLLSLFPLQLLMGHGRGRRLGPRGVAGRGSVGVRVTATAPRASVPGLLLLGARPQGIMLREDREVVAMVGVLVLPRQRHTSTSTLSDYTVGVLK